MSCNTPIGQITEQYTLPKRRVIATKPATIARLIANTAGRNWTLAIHPNQVWIVPVKSRKSSVAPTKKINPNVILRFLNILSYKIC